MPGPAPLIICCGNPNRGDDGAGPLVARRLTELGIKVRELSGEASALLEAFETSENVILVDAVVTGRELGAVHVWDAHSAPVVRESFRCSTHAFGVAEAIELARVLGRLPARIRIFGVEGGRFTMEEEPSPAVLEVVESVARQIQQEVIACTKHL